MSSKRNQLNRDLLAAVARRDIEQVRELLHRGADVNATDKEHNETPLILAAKFANADVVRLLVGAGAAIDAQDDWGRTAMFYAPISSEVFKALIESGADVHTRDKRGDTILMRKVSESASLAEVEELLGLGVDPGARNESGETALDLAVSLGLVLIVERLKSSTAS